MELNPRRKLDQHYIGEMCGELGLILDFVAFHIHLECVVPKTRVRQPGKESRSQQQCNAS